MNSTRSITKNGRVTIKVADQWEVTVPVPVDAIALCHRSSTKNEGLCREWLESTYDFVVSLMTVELDEVSDVWVFGDSSTEKCQGPTLTPGRYEILLHYNAPYASKKFLDIYHMKLDEESGETSGT